MFPLVSAEELRELADDIKTNGLHEPVTIVYGESGDRILLDGRNRLDAMQLLGIEVFDDGGGCRYSGSVHALREDALAFVISKNIRRRHLTSDQKRDVIAKLLKATPEKSNRSVAKTVGVDDKTVGAVREQLLATAEIPQLPKTTGADGRARPATKPRRPVVIEGEAVNVSASDAVAVHAAAVIPMQANPNRAAVDACAVKEAAREARRQERAALPAAPFSTAAAAGASIAMAKDLFVRMIWRPVPAHARIALRAALVELMDADLRKGSR